MPTWISIYWCLVPRYSSSLTTAILSLFWICIHLHGFKSFPWKPGVPRLVFDLFIFCSQNMTAVLYFRGRCKLYPCALCFISNIRRTFTNLQNGIGLLQSRICKYFHFRLQTHPSDVVIIWPATIQSAATFFEGKCVVGRILLPMLRKYSSLRVRLLTSKAKPTIEECNPLFESARAGDIFCRQL